MRAHARYALAAIALAALLWPAASRADDGAEPLGKNLAGESCSLAAQTGGTRAILCGSEEAGLLATAPFAPRAGDDEAARGAAILAAAKAMSVGLGRGPDLRCDGGTSVAEEGVSLLFACALSSNAWPRVVLLSARGGVLYQGEGIPALLPVLQAAIAQLSGRAQSAGETEGATRLLEQRFPGALARAGGTELASNTALIEFARLDAAQHNYAGAEASYRRALDIETRLFGAIAPAVGQTLMELALQVSNQSRFDEADGLFRRAAPIIEATGNLTARARFQSYRALDAANQRHFADALKFAHAATEMRRAALAAEQPQAADDTAAPFVSGRSELAHGLRIEAEMAMKLGDLPAALADAEEVLGIVSQEPGLPLWWRPDAVAMMADINAQQGRVVEAERQYREALVMDVKLFGEIAPTAFAELRLGGFYTVQELYPAAVAVFRQAFEILEHDEVARAAIEPDDLLPFLAAARTLIARGDQNRAALEQDMFRAGQLVASDVESRTIARAAARLASDTPSLAELTRAMESTQRERDRVRISLAAETAKSDDQRDPARERKLAAAVQEGTQKLGALTQQLAAAFPDYKKMADPGPAVLATIERQLAEHEAFLSLVVGAKASFALVVRRSGLTVAPLELTESSLADDVTELRKAFEPRLGGMAPFDVVAAYELYRKLIGPVEPALAGIDHLIVAPAGALASLPLSLLVTDAPDPRKDYSQAAWLVRRFALSQVPSPRAFLALREAAARPSRAAKPMLAVADPSFSGPLRASEGKTALGALADTCRSEGPIAPDLIRALPPLHETAAEVRTVARLLGAGDDAILLAGAATESSFRAQPLDQYRVLYFATHGLLPGELHCQSEPGLVLSPPPKPARSAAEDGLLDASEIAELRLDADLVVLSACNTAASGGTFGGAALGGLADAFFAAGARSVLASNWEVPSLASVRLMTGLFENYARTRGTGLADSLRQSQLAMIRDAATAHPYNWAAFTIIGDGAKAPLAPAEDKPSGGRS